MKETTHLKEIIITAVILFIALIFRLNYVVLTDVDTPVRADARYYCIYAYNLVHHGVFSKQIGDDPKPDSYWPPAYPALIATILYLTDSKHFYSIILVVQAVLGSFAAAMVFNIGLFFLPQWAAATAGVLTACSPHLISMGGYLLTETLFTFMIVFYLLVYILATRAQKYFWFGFSGALAGISYLVNPVIFFAPFLMTTIHCVIQKKTKFSCSARSQKAIAIFLIAFILPVIFWSARNRLHVPSDATSSVDRALDNFIIGAHHDYSEIWRNNMRDPTNPAELDKISANGSWLMFLKILAPKIYDNPKHYAKWYLYDKPKLLWSWDILIGQDDIYVYPVLTSWFQTSKLASTLHSIMKAIHEWLIFFCAVGGIFILRNIRRDPDEKAAVIYTMMVYVSAVYVILQAEPRYSIPLRPLMYMGALYGLWQSNCMMKKLLDHPRMKKLIGKP